MVLTPEQMFALAATAERNADHASAARVYDALEKDRSPDVRAEARFRLAKLRAASGDRTGAAVLLRRILDEKPSAAPVRLALAQLLIAMGDEPAALRELRAVRTGKLPIEVARLVDRFSEALRVRKPLGASFEIALAPDSNINRATRSDTVGTVLGPFDISDDGKASSGIGLALRGQAYRRIALGESVDVLARASASADLYRQSDYNDLALDLSAGPEMRLGRNRLRLELGASRRWFGQQAFQDTARVSAAIARPLGTRTQVSIDASAALIDNRVADLQDGKFYSARVAVEHALSPTTGVAVNFGGDRFLASDPGYSTRGWRAGLVAWRDIGRATFTAGAQFGRLKADERLLLFPEKRSDSYSRFSIGATFRQMTIGGFAPVTRFSIERNKSSIEFYDYSRTRTEFGIVRAF